MLRVPMPVRVGGVLFLKVGRVREHEPEKVGSSRGTIHRAPEPIPHDQRQMAGVVDVGVTEYDGVDVGRLERRRTPVAFTEFLQPLEHAAVQQDLAAADAHEML
jgi:hypothetical protein